MDLCYTSVQPLNISPQIQSCQTKRFEFPKSTFFSFVSRQDLRCLNRFSNNAYCTKKEGISFSNNKAALKQYKSFL